MGPIGRTIDLFLIDWLFIATMAVIPLLVLGEARSLSPSGNAFLRLLIVPSLLATPILLLPRFREMVILLVRNPLIPILLVWVWLSVFWSVMPDIAFRRALSLTTFTLLACYLTLRHDPEWVFKTMSWMMIVLLAVSVLFIVLLQGLSQMPDGRGLRGIFTHKNGMGEFLILTLIILPPAIQQRLIPKPLGWTCVALAIGLLILVNSATATLAALTVLLLYVVLAHFAYSVRIGLILSAFFLSLSCLVVVLIMINLDTIFALTGRDATLTGRTELWHYVITMIEKRWLLGYGYASFWEVLAFSKYAADSLRWDIPNAHNGYLDIILGLGVIGLFILFAFFLNGFYRIVVHFKESSYFPSAILLALLTAYLMRGLTESNFLSQNSIIWVFVVTSTVFLSPSPTMKIKRGNANNPDPQTS